MATSSTFPVFTEEMRLTHTILIPDMLPMHFRLMQAVLESCGYKASILKNEGRQVIDAGLRYVNNDICYPAQLVIGQFIDALQSGQYDLQHVALLLSQTGGGCRASNYIYLLRKGLEKAGLGGIPIISFNVAGLEGQPGFKLTLSMARKLLAAVIYGDVLMYLSNKVRPYEAVKEEVDGLVQEWLQRLAAGFKNGSIQSLSAIKKFSTAIARDFAALPTKAIEKIKVGIVGEIYIKFAALGNNNLEKFLQSQDCEYMLPGLLHFLIYCVDTYVIDYQLYGGRLGSYLANSAAKWYLKRLEKVMRKALSLPPFTPPSSYEETKALAKGIIGYGNNMGEGWLLTAEMLELSHHGYNNIICCQPFGCLPNHIAGRGMINRLKELVDRLNIIAIDYDGSASQVNQENRIKLMLATAQR